jgi:threonine dehydrogenase-like Zn-dependent dehydrogenase
LKAVTWQGTHKIEVCDVPDPHIMNPRDALVRVTSTAICGSDLHFYNGRVLGFQAGDVVGHEFMGEVVEVGSAVKNLAAGDRVVVPFPIACGACEPCAHTDTSLCDNSNPNAYIVEAAYGYAPAALFGYSHLFGGYAGGQAEYVRVPYADFGPLKIESDLADEQVLFLSDILPTGYQAAEVCNIEPGDVVAVWGCGPVGQFAIKSAYLLGAEKVIAFDRFDYRRKLAHEFGGAIAVDPDTINVVDFLREMTGGRGPDACIDAVGMEAHGLSAMAMLDQVKQAAKIETDRPHVLREAIQAAGKGATVSLAGVYTGFVDSIPFGAAFGKGLTLRMGQTNVHRYLRPLLERIERKEFDPAAIVTHRGSLDDAPRLYDVFQRHADGCEKVVMTTARA